MTAAPKQKRIDAIHQSILAISEYFEINPAHLLSEEPRKGLGPARGILIYHLHNQGVSLENISRLVKRSTDSVRKSNHEAVIRMQPEEATLIASLPSIPINQTSSTTKSPVGREG